MTDLNVELDWFNYDKQESIVKGDALLKGGRRVILMTTNDHLDILAKSPQILADGTFRTTPEPWLQNFIISAQVCGSVFVPVCFVLLPDKTRESYDNMFCMLKEALGSRGLELSAQYFMSDFEVAIRNSFTSHFPDVTPKGCLFHFSKAILSKVSKSGFKSDYSNKSSPQFGSFVRAILGFGYVPLYRFKEALRNLYVLAKRLTGRQRKFSRRMIEYVEKVWVNGNFPPETRTRFQRSRQKET